MTTYWGAIFVVLWVFQRTQYMFVWSGMNARDHNRDKVLKKGVSDRSAKDQNFGVHVFGEQLLWSWLFVIKEKTLDVYRQPSKGYDRGSISDLSHSRWTPSDAYLRGECKFQLGSIGAHRLSNVQYLPEEQVNSTDSQWFLQKAYSSEFCVGASLLPDINRSRWN
jgi:hypothetical protein